MRTIDTAKRDKVIQTVLQITMEEGLAALSFDKLAKRAGISSGTPYVYYKDKTDMLSCIYAQVWQGLQEGLQQAIDMGRTPGERLFFGLRQLAQTLLAHPQEAHFFLSVVNAPEFVTAEALQENSLPSPPLMAVYQEAIAPPPDENRQRGLHQRRAVWPAVPDFAAAPAERHPRRHERGGKGAGSLRFRRAEDPIKGDFWKRNNYFVK